MVSSAMEADAMSEHDDERSNDREDKPETRDMPYEGERPKRPSGKAERDVPAVGDIGEEGDRPKRPSGR
jgi:hypothetical protein